MGRGDAQITDLTNPTEYRILRHGLISEQYKPTRPRLMVVGWANLARLRGPASASATRLRLAILD